LNKPHDDDDSKKWMSAVLVAATGHSPVSSELSTAGTYLKLLKVLDQHSVVDASPVFTAVVTVT